MKVPVVLMLLSACGGETPPPMTAAAVARSPAAVAELVRDEVVDGGLWFADAACEREFGPPQKVVAPRTKAFAQCLRALPLRVSTRVDAMPDVVVLTYEPGFEIEARVVDDRLTWIGWEGERDARDTAPTLTAAAFKALRTDSAPPGDIAPEDKTAFAWVKVCIDTAGNTTNVEGRQATSARTSTRMLAIANAWQFRAFDAGHGAIPVCALVRLGTPADTEELPWPPAPEDKGMLLVPITSAKRLSGNTQITPDDEEKRVMQQHHVALIRGAFKLCVDTEGKVASTRMIRSTGLPGYDAEILERMKSWVYAPFAGEDGPVPACTGVVFTYSQR